MSEGEAERRAKRVGASGGMERHGPIRRAGGRLLDCGRDAAPKARGLDDWRRISCGRHRRAADRRELTPALPGGGAADANCHADLPSVRGTEGGMSTGATAAWQVPVVARARPKRCRENSRSVRRNSKLRPLLTDFEPEPLPVRLVHAGQGRFPSKCEASSITPPRAFALCSRRSTWRIEPGRAHDRA